MRYRLSLIDMESGVVDYWYIKNDEMDEDGPDEVYHKDQSFNIDIADDQLELCEEIQQAVGLAVQADQEAQAEMYKDNFWSQIEDQVDDNMKEQIKEYREKESHGK